MKNINPSRGSFSAILRFNVNWYTDSRVIWSDGVYDFKGFHDIRQNNVTAIVHRNWNLHCELNWTQRDDSHIPFYTYSLVSERVKFKPANSPTRKLHNFKLFLYPPPKFFCLFSQLPTNRYPGFFSITLRVKRNKNIFFFTFWSTFVTRSLNFILFLYSRE